MGLSCSASNDNCLALGNTAIASGLGSIAIGNTVTANGQYASGMGQYITASGVNSVAIGKYLNTDSGAANSFVFGRGKTTRFTNDATDSLMVVFGNDLPTFFVNDWAAAVNTKTPTAEFTVAGSADISNTVLASTVTARVQLELPVLGTFNPASTPTKKGIMIFDNATNTVYVATGTAPGAWKPIW
jgi:autotransporter adhesin